jgi:hypothetical protein
MAEAIQAYHISIDMAEVLEQLVDQHGLLHAVTGLELVCAEKAQHLRDQLARRPICKGMGPCSRMISTA